MGNLPAKEIERLIVALDIADSAKALNLVEQLDGLVGFFKVGNQLFTSEGPPLVRELVKSGRRVFLDLKFHDIPNTVAEAVRSAIGLGVHMLNVHCLGGAEMMTAAARALCEPAAPDDDPSASGSGQHLIRPVLLGVTLLTSMDEYTLRQIGLESSVHEEVGRLARLAAASGLDGVVASPREIPVIREAVDSRRFLIVTPGVRPLEAEAGDQKRVATPSEAIRLGADFIVVGRPITGASDSRAAATRILDEIAGLQ